jgi:hypothetical protein
LEGKVTRIGSKTWAVAGGRIPLGSTGEEPEYTSQDIVCILNASSRGARVSVTVYYADRDPVGPYRLAVPARRTRHVRLNDLIDPLPVPLAADYACIVRSSVPVVVQFLRRDTSQAENAWLGLAALPCGG